MFKQGDRVRVKSSQAVGVVQEVMTDNEVCVEFDQQAATRQAFSNDDIDLIPPGSDLGSSQLLHPDL